MTNSDPAPAPQPASPRPLNRPWLSLLLSLLVPGFGLLRAGRVARGFTWFISLQGLAVFVAMLATWRAIPGWIILGALAFNLLCYLAMLVDSFRPGRLTSAGWFIFVAVFLALAFLPASHQLVARAFNIPNSNMKPTLQPGDQVFVDRLSYAFSNPKRGDLVAFRTTGLPKLPADQFYLKRLVGLPGEKIEIRDGHLFADGRLLGEKDGIPNITYTIPSAQDATGVYEVPLDAYFFLGDNSLNSSDSRYWGSVPRGNIYGRVARIYYPFDRLGVPK